MRSDVSEVLVAMGFAPLREFRAFDNGDGTARLQWLSQRGQPSGGEIEAYDLLPARKESAAGSIDVAAGVARSRYITVAPGQEGTYVYKAEHARAFKAAGYPAANVADYPLVQARAEAYNE